MDHDDILHETALYEVAVEINAHPDVDVIYSDEDKIDRGRARATALLQAGLQSRIAARPEHGQPSRRLSPQPDRANRRLSTRLRGQPGLRPGPASLGGVVQRSHPPYSGGALSLAPRRASGKLLRIAARAVHRWPARRAIQEFLDREGEGATVVAAPKASICSRVIRKIPEPKPLVSVIVLTKDRADLLSVCADGVLNKTDYPEPRVPDRRSRQQGAGDARPFRDAASAIRA